MDIGNDVKRRALALLMGAGLAFGSLGACAGDQAPSPGEIEHEQDTDPPAGLQEDTRPEQDGSENVGNEDDDNPRD